MKNLDERMMEMKVPRFICALMIVWMACALQGVSRPLELLHVVDLQLPERPMGIVPDVRGINGPCVYQHCFVFSAQDQKNGRFNLHYKYMTVEDAYKRKNSIEDYAGDIVVTGCVRAVITQTPCYQKGLILDCATEMDPCGLSSHCDMYLLEREVNSLGTLPFAERSLCKGLFTYVVEESVYRGMDSESNCVSKVWLLRKELNGDARPPKWSIVEAVIDMNSFSNVSERVVTSYEDYSSPGLSL